MPGLLSFIAAAPPAPQDGLAMSRVDEYQPGVPAQDRLTLPPLFELRCGEKHNQLI